MKKIKIPNENKICINCDNCIYIGDGDYICDSMYDTEKNTPILIMEEHTPNDNYWCCNGTEWESDEFE